MIKELKNANKIDIQKLRRRGKAKKKTSKNVSKRNKNESIKIRTARLNKPATLRDLHYLEMSIKRIIAKEKQFLQKQIFEIHNKSEVKNDKKKV